MEEKMKKLSFKKLMETYDVCIPMIQRDYAYGRVDEEEKRNSFLRNLKSYFSNPEPHELDFIYGSVENGTLILLDGQQRITTLFLLHWYLSLVKYDGNMTHFDSFRCLMLNEKERKSRFSYKTRFSSSDFCNALVSLTDDDVDYSQRYHEIIEAVDAKHPLSKEIKKEKWFLPHWNYDPTIISMLNMLDAIAAVFPIADCRDQDYYRLITDEEKIVFNFLNLDDFKLTDELYIKMNSRGRPLTRFENLKSKILKLYDEACVNAPEEYKRRFEKITKESGKSYKSLRDYVSSMFDTKWTDIFWNEWLRIKDPCSDEAPNIDNMMLSFICVMSVYDYILIRMDGNLSVGRKDEITREINSLMSAKDPNKGITISYDKLIKLFSKDVNDYEILFNMIDYFNIFNDDGKRKTYLPSDFSLFSEEQAFEMLISDHKNDMRYEDKAKTFAFVKYLKENPYPDSKRLKEWMRFVCHVCSNSYNLPNYTDTFCSGIAGINHLYDEDIVSNLQHKDLTGITTLDTSQIEEELLKFTLSENPDWSAAIKDAEIRLSYFEGRLSFPLIECCHVTKDDVRFSEKIKEFEKYVKKISSIFPSKNGCDCENELIRAMLSKGSRNGNYMMYYKSKHTLLKNADRDNSWRHFLKEKPNSHYPFDDNDMDKREYFKAVIDDPIFDADNVTASLAKIAKNRSDSLPNWMKLIIDVREILDGTDVQAFGNDRFLRWNDSPPGLHKQNSEDNYEIVLIPGRSTNGRHAELFSLCKYFELKEKAFGTWGTAVYQKTTTMEQPYFYLQKGEEIIKIKYQDDNCFKFIHRSLETEEEWCKDVPSEDVENKLREVLP